VKYQKICPDGVQIFTTAEHIASDYREIALLHSKGESGWTTERGMMSSQRQKAAALGANGIVLNNIKEPNAGTKIIGAILGTGSERQGAAVAIYIPADSERVRQACGLAPKENQIASSRALLRGGSASVHRPGEGISLTEQAPAAKVAPVQTDTVDQAAVAPEVAGYVAASADAAQTPEQTAMIVQNQALARAPVSNRAAGAGRFRGDLLRFPQLRQALNDVIRIGIATDYQESRWGILRLQLGSRYDGAAVEYYLNRVWWAYKAATEDGSAEVIELWQNGRKLGEFGNDGLLAGPEFSAPR
jgi:hypothetical protein